MSVDAGERVDLEPHTVVTVVPAPDLPDAKRRKIVALDGLVCAIRRVEQVQCPGFFVHTFLDKRSVEPNLPPGRFRVFRSGVLCALDGEW